MGLDNAGKTSIILSLQKETNLLTYYNLNPTKGVQTVNLEDIERRLNIWDFGGQSIYRQDHINAFKKYVDRVNKLIYVVDIQDSKRYQESLDYFKKIMELIEKWKMLIPIDIFLHKFDPGLEMASASLVNSEIPKFVKNLIGMIPKDIIYKVFKTSIFTIFQKDKYL